MTTKVKLDSKLGAPASAAIELVAQAIYNRPGARMVAIVELAHTERTQPAPEEDTDPSVKLTIKHLELAREGKHDEWVRKAMRALYLQRTAQGKLDEAYEVELSERTLAQTADLLQGVEVARLRTVVSHWGEYAARCARMQDVTIAQLQNELETLGSALLGTLRWATDDGDND